MTVIITVVDDEHSSGEYFVAKTDNHTIQDIVDKWEDL
jgi:hypothetical protein